MTPEERSALDRQRQVARTPGIATERREPLPGQAELPIATAERKGWSLVTSRPLSEEQARAADELARAEAGAKGGRPKGWRKKGGETCQ